MEARFIARRKQLLDGATIRPEVAEGLPERLAAFLEHRFSQRVNRHNRITLTGHVATKIRVQAVLGHMRAKSGEACPTGHVAGWDCERGEDIRR